MPDGLADLFTRRRAEISGRGWPTPPAHQVSQREQKVWLDYWRSLDQRAEREGWVLHSGKGGLTKPEERA